MICASCRGTGNGRDLQARGCADCGGSRVKFDPAAFLKIVADDLGSLRKCDVFRLLDTCSPENRGPMAAYVVGGRKDLAEEVISCLKDIEMETV